MRLARRLSRHTLKRFNDLKVRHEWLFMPSVSLREYSSSLAESFQALFDYRAEFQNRRFSSYDEAAREISLNWDPRFLPNFEMKDGQPVSRQQNSFTLFSFSEALSELLVGIEQLGAYHLLGSNDFDQFANFVSYTSNFHLID